MAGAKRVRDVIGTGLNDHEQIAATAGAVFGDWHQRLGLVDEVDGLRRRIADLESRENRRALPWYLRWTVRDKKVKAN